MRISRLSFHNVGPFDDAVLELPEPEGEGELVLFEGPNGSGKTTIAQAIAVLAAIGDRGAAPWQTFRRRLREQGRAAATFVDGAESQTLYCAATGVDSETHGPTQVFETLKSFWHLESTIEVRSSWAAFAYHAHVQSAQLSSEGPRELKSSPLIDALSFSGGASGQLLGQLLTNLEFERVQYAQYATERPVEAEQLRAASESRKKAIHRLEVAFSRILGRTVSFVFVPGRQAPRMLFDGEEIPVDLLGEGMRSAASWLGDLLVRLERIPWADETRSPWEQEFWLILDEIEASLHPTLQLQLLPTLRELFPRARIYATTHSPFVVASAAGGHVFAIRPDPKTHRVSGNVAPIKLTPGQSLEWVVEAVFGAPTGIIDPETRSAIAEHEREVEAIARGEAIDWTTFLERRRRLVGLNEEVGTVVRMTEVPARKAIEAKILGAAA